MVQQNEADFHKCRIAKKKVMFTVNKNNNTIYFTNSIFPTTKVNSEELPSAGLHQRTNRTTQSRVRLARINN
jgi:hypothetical protein